MTAGVLSLTLWPHLLASRALPDRAALRLGIGCLALTSASLSLWSASARVLWAARRASADSSCPTPLPRPRRVLRTLRVRCCLSAPSPSGWCAAYPPRSSPRRRRRPSGASALPLGTRRNGGGRCNRRGSSPLGAVLGRLDAAGSLCRVLLPPAAGALADGPGLWAAFAAQAALCLGGLACTEWWWFRRAQAGQAQERLKAA